MQQCACVIEENCIPLRVEWLQPVRAAARLNGQKPVIHGLRCNQPSPVQDAAVHY